jgi:4-diphosphocytidyl-2-C-methyl-D-erythritol kinase
MSRPAKRASRRSARAPALAKLNLGLRVLGKRPDGYHELRTIFQTISLADTLEIAFTPGRASEVEIEDAAHIPDNLAVRAARLAMEAAGISGRVQISLKKRIPLGAGLGGGSSDAAAVLLALPALAGVRLETGVLAGLAAALGSDVPFFLEGGTAVAIGRGTELFPLPDAPAAAGILIASALHVDTTWAYRTLSTRLTSESQQNKIVSFQAQSWNPLAGGLSSNDFEEVVFEKYSRLASLKAELTRSGASLAMMTGSGSALFGLYSSRAQGARALRWLARPGGLNEDERAIEFSLVNRARYRSLWRRALKEYIKPELWPPQIRLNIAVKIA